MKWIISLTLLATAAYAVDLKPIDLPSPAAPEVSADNEGKTPVKVVEQVELVQAELPAVEITPVNVIDLNSIMTEKSLNPIELPSPAKPEVSEDSPIESVAPSTVKVVEDATADAAPSTVEVIDTPTAEPVAETIKVEMPTIPEILASEIKPSSVKVVETPQENPTVATISETVDVSPIQIVNFPQQDGDTVVVKADSVRVVDIPTAIHMMPEAARNLIDISPAFVTFDVLDEQRRPLVSPFLFNSAQPLESIERVKVVDSPVNELDREMSPVVVAGSLELQGFETPDATVFPSGGIKVVNVPQGPYRPVPAANWRGPQGYHPVPPFYRGSEKLTPPRYPNPTWR